MEDPRLTPTATWGLPAFRQAAPHASLRDLGAVSFPHPRQPGPLPHGAAPGASAGAAVCAALSPLQRTTGEAARNDGAHGNSAEGLDEDDRGTGGHALVGEVEDP